MNDPVETWRYVVLIAFAVVVICVFAYWLGGFAEGDDDSDDDDPGSWGAW